MKRTGPTNPITKDIISKLNRTKVPILKKVADTLEKPTRSRPEINLSRLSLHTEKGQNVVVPGKVLGSGVIDFPLNIAALSFSDTARKKIIAAGGTVHTIDEFAENTPKGLRLIK